MIFNYLLFTIIYSYSLFIITAIAIVHIPLPVLLPLLLPLLMTIISELPFTIITIIITITYSINNTIMNYSLLTIITTFTIESLLLLIYLLITVNNYC